MGGPYGDNMPAIRLAATGDQIAPGPASQLVDLPAATGLLVEEFPDPFEELPEDEPDEDGPEEDEPEEDEPEPDEDEPESADLAAAGLDSFAAALPESDEVAAAASALSAFSVPVATAPERLSVR